MPGCCVCACFEMDAEVRPFCTYLIGQWCSPRSFERRRGRLSALVPLLALGRRGGREALYAYVRRYDPRLCPDIVRRLGQEAKLPRIVVGDALLLNGVVEEPKLLTGRDSSMVALYLIGNAGHAGLFLLLLFFGCVFPPPLLF